MGDPDVKVRLGQLIPAAEARRDLDALAARLERYFAASLEEMGATAEP